MESPENLATTVERRQDRSETTLGALSRLLEAARQRTRLEALALADAAGFLVAGAGAARLCDELAAYAPLVAKSADNDTVPNSLQASERRLRSQRLCIDGIEIFLCNSGPRDADLSEVARGCLRILGHRSRFAFTS